MRVKVSPTQVQAAFAKVSDDPSFEESRALAARGHMPAEMIQAFTLRPEILRAFAGFGHSVYPGGQLERLRQQPTIERQIGRLQRRADAHEFADRALRRRKVSFNVPFEDVHAVTPSCARQYSERKTWRGSKRARSAQKSSQRGYWRRE